MTTLQKTEYIAPYQQVLIFLELSKTLTNEVGMLAIGLHTDHLFAASADEFQ